MTKEELQKLGTGVYRFYWISGGNTVGVISRGKEGENRIHCSNWSNDRIQPLDLMDGDLKMVELLATAEGDEEGETDEPNYSTTPFQLAGSQPPSKTLMELDYEEEAELIRAATALLTFNHGQATLIRPALEAASEYLASKFKEASNVESD